MYQALLLSFYCAAIVAASLIGGVLPSLLRLSHTRMQVLMSGVGGFMVGVAVLHLLPHSASELHSLDQSANWMLFGIVAMFLLIRVFHVHQHAVMEPEAHDHASHHHAEDHVHGAACDHDHHHSHGDAASPNFSWAGLAFGLALHTLIDGLALGAAVSSGVYESFAIFLAVALHKPLDALSITSTMAAGGWSARDRMLANGAFALMCPLGAALFFFGVAVQPTGTQQFLVGAALAFSAGVFLCVALADILPELSFHSHDRYTLLASLLIGVVLAWAIGYLEPSHTHQTTTSTWKPSFYLFTIGPLQPDASKNRYHC